MDAIQRLVDMLGPHLKENPILDIWYNSTIESLKQGDNAAWLYGRIEERFYSMPQGYPFPVLYLIRFKRALVYCR